MQPITIYWRGRRVIKEALGWEELTVFPDGVPNPAKVVVVLEELGLPYVSKYIDLPELKSEPYVSINPNGRLPGTPQIHMTYVTATLSLAPKLSRIQTLVSSCGNPAPLLDI